MVMWGKKRAAGLALAAILAAPVVAAAGPVPGQETITRSAVDFATPDSVVVYDLGNNLYEVTFSWAPPAEASDPGVAGDFNKWNRDADRLAGPDAEGRFSATLRIPAGIYEYKFYSAGDQWHNDPLNPDIAPGHDNNVLKLGIFAYLDGMTGTPGDGRIEERALRHDHEAFTFYDVFSPTDVQIRVQALKGDVEAAHLRLLKGGRLLQSVPMTFAAADEQFDFFEYHVALNTMPVKPDGYAFTIEDGATALVLPDHYPLAFDESRMMDTPDWAKEVVWYQIMIDRFRNGDPSNDPEHLEGTWRVRHTSDWKADHKKVQEWEREGDKGLFEADGTGAGEPAIYSRLYGGDFAGVQEKLDYLADLGVTAIYFNPIFESPTCHKYDGRAFHHADDGYGTAGQFDKAVAQEDLTDSSTWVMTRSDEQFFELLREAKKRGMRVIIDGVFNHLGDEAVPFLDVREKGPASRYSDWYDIVSWDPFEYRGWAGFGGLPQFAKDQERGLASDSLIAYIYDSTRKWMDPNGDGDPSDGVDGWRLDVPMDVPMPFWRGWRQHVKSINPEAYIVGEVWDPAEEWLQGDTMDAVMNYQFRVAALRFFGDQEDQISPTQFDGELARLRIRYPRAATYVMQNLLDSHDTDRIASRLMNPDLGENRLYDGANRIQDTGPNYDDSQPTDEAYQKLKMLALFQSTYVGAPMIYYGTEKGMYGADDPMCRKPMWWPDLMPYENPDYEIQADVLEAYRAALHLRTENPVLSHGDYRTILADDSQRVFGFIRYSLEKPENVVVLFNNGGQAQEVEIAAPGEEVLPSGFRGARVLLAEPGARIRRATETELKITIPPLTGMAILVQDKATDIAMNSEGPES